MKTTVQLLKSIREAFCLDIRRDLRRFQDRIPLFFVDSAGRHFLLKLLREGGDPKTLDKLVPGYGIGDMVEEVLASGVRVGFARKPATLAEMRLHDKLRNELESAVSTACTRRSIPIDLGLECAKLCLIYREATHLRSDHNHGIDQLDVSRIVDERARESLHKHARERWADEIANLGAVGGTVVVVDLRTSNPPDVVHAMRSTDGLTLLVIDSGAPLNDAIVRLIGNWLSFGVPAPNDGAYLRVQDERLPLRLLAIVEEPAPFLGCPDWYRDLGMEVHGMFTWRNCFPEVDSVSKG